MSCRFWLFAVVAALAALVAWVVVLAPRSARHLQAPRSARQLPVLERVAFHAFMATFGYVQRALEYLSDHCGYDYFQMFRPIINSLVAKAPADPRVKMINQEFDGVSVRMYFPDNRESTSGALLFIHGGGWAYLNLDHYDGVCQSFALELRAVVVSVEYRLLPESHYPEPLDDCFFALGYLMRNAHRWNIDPTRIAVAGDSAGGHLAAALSIRWRDEILKKQGTGEARGGLVESPLPPIRMQVLIYPVLQLVNMTFASNIANVDVMHRRTGFCRLVRLLAFPDRQKDRALLDALCASNHTTRATRERLAKYFHFGPVSAIEDEVDSLVTAEQRALAASVRNAEEHPEGDPQVEAELLPHLLEPLVSPLLVDSFEGLPNTYMVTVEFDALRDDGLLFVRRMRAAAAAKSGAGPLVAHKHYPLYTHGFINMGVVGVLEKELAEYLRQNPKFF